MTSLGVPLVARVSFDEEMQEGEGVASAHAGAVHGGECGAVVEVAKPVEPVLKRCRGKDFLSLLLLLLQNAYIRDTFEDARTHVFVPEPVLANGNGSDVRMYLLYSVPLALNRVLYVNGWK